MRILRSLALALAALAAPLMRGAAQTCQGMSAFQDGRARVGVDDQYNSDFNDVRGAFVYGVPRSFYGGLSVDQLQVGHGGPSMTGIAAKLGYQIHLSDTPFQVCPEVWGRFTSGSDTTRFQFAFGASVGYRVEISDWFSVVPAAGLWSIRTYWGAENGYNGASKFGSLPPFPGSQQGTTSQVSMEMGLVFNKAFTISPGILVPSQSGAKSIYTIGVSINWANAVPR